MRILIADDEAFVVEGLTLLLHQNLPQVEIMTADNGRSALAVLRERGAEPDLLITDLNMPLMDGIELSQQIRRRYPRCRIMIISGYEDFEAARSAIELGALRYMLKPINHTEMVAYVRSVLEDVVREQDERIRHSTDRLESLLVDMHNHMLLDAPYGGRRTHRQGNGGLLRRAPCGGEPPRRRRRSLAAPGGGKGPEKPRRAELSDPRRGRAGNAAAVRLWGGGRVLAGRPAAGAGGRGAVSPWRWGWDGGAARSGRFISPTGRRAWRCGGPTWRMGMPSVSTTT